MDKEDPSAHNLVDEDGGLMSQLLPHSSLKSQLAEAVVDNDFQSRPIYTISYTHNETLE